MYILINAEEFFGAYEINIVLVVLGGSRREREIPEQWQRVREHL